MNMQWQSVGRNCFVYVDDETKQIYGEITWNEDKRLMINARYLGPHTRNKNQKPVIVDNSLGFWFDEKAAKKAVVEHVAEMFPEQPKETEE